MASSGYPSGNRAAGLQRDHRLERAAQRRRYKLEPGDTFTLSADKLTLSYRFVNHGFIDGLDFRTACATRLKIKGVMAGVKLPIGRIWIGRAGHHPLQNPFVILRNR